jgi:hydrogenase maturation protease
MSRPLVIGIGNTLRSDDAAGIVAVEELSRRYPQADCLTVHQLGPELAEQVAAARTVVFVDASVLVRAVSIQHLRPGQGIVSSHVATPEVLLGLCEQLHGATPRAAFLVEIPARHLGFGETLTDLTATAVQEAVEVIIRLLSGEPAGHQPRPTAVR